MVNEIRRIWNVPEIEEKFKYGPQEMAPNYNTKSISRTAMIFIYLVTLKMSLFNSIKIC